MLENIILDLKLFWYFFGSVAEAMWWVGCGGYVVGWLRIDNKANLVQLLLQLSTGTKLGKIRIFI